MSTPEIKRHAQSPPPGLELWVECVWSIESRGPAATIPVPPDGCIDIVYSRPSGLQAVGAMTFVRRFNLPAGSTAIGVRFLPGMACGFLGMPAGELTDRAVPFNGMGNLESRLDNARGAEECCGMLAAALHIPHTRPDPVHRAIAAMTRARGLTDLDWIADQAGLSVRQFRRRCLKESGLTPKHLCRVLRFRNAVALARRTRPDWASIAADAGYFDQAHLIRDFREFAGETPMAVFSNTEAARVV